MLAEASIICVRVCLTMVTPLVPFSPDGGGCPHSFLLLLRENKTVGCLTNVDPSVLDDVLALPHLSDYARETLTECKP